MEEDGRGWMRPELPGDSFLFLTFPLVSNEQFLLGSGIGTGSF